MPRPWRCAVALVALAASPAPCSAMGSQDDSKAQVVLALDDQANVIWSDLPESADDSQVTRLGRTPAACATEALRRAKDVVGRREAGRAALRRLSLEAPVLQPAIDARCPAAVWYEIRPPSDAEAPPYLHMLIEGGCRCGEPGPEAARARRFQIVGRAELEPLTLRPQGEGVRWLWKAKQPSYLVLASCTPCREEGERQPVEAAASGLSPCGRACAALTQAATGWRREVQSAEAEAAALGGSVAALEADVSRQRQEVDAAQRAPRRSRSWQDRIAALQAELKTRQEGLARARRTADEVQERLTDLRRAQNETAAADERCQAQCATPPPPSATVRPAGGGGLGAKTLILGGVAAGGVAAGIVAATSGGEEPARTAESQYVLSGDANPATPFGIDDFLRVFLDGQPLGDFFGCRTFTGPCFPADPISFRAASGRSLVVEAYDYGGGPYGLGPVYLHKDGRLASLLIPRVDCNAPPVPCPTPGGSGPVLFFRQTYPLP